MDMYSMDSSYCLLPDMWPEAKVLDCRCGTTGDGNDMMRLVNLQGDVVRCQLCDTYSHIACQQHDERTSSLGNGNASFDFICDDCDPARCFKYGTRALQSQHKQFFLKIQRFKLPLADRLYPGIGALARRGKFWYPVRLVRKLGGSWVVQWWRENIYASTDAEDISLEQISTVSMENITDSLWMDRRARRAIQLGHWRHPHEVMDPEDRLSDPSSIPYTTSIHNILSPHSKTLEHLLWDISSFSRNDVIPIPAKAWLEENNRSASTAIVPYAGLLSLAERSQISNWFEVHISKDISLRSRWLGLLPLAHAFTIYIAAGLRSRHPNKYRNYDENGLFGAAWMIQVSEALPLKIKNDVEKECLSSLEDEMFEVSARAGIAGHYQWGLDVGSHQDNWDPYWNLPTYLNHGDYKGLGNNDELEPGPDFSKELDQVTVEQKVHPTSIRPRPKPRPLFKKLATMTLKGGA